MKAIKRIFVLMMAVTIMVLCVPGTNVQARTAFADTSNTIVWTYPSSGEYFISTPGQVGIVSMYSDVNGYNCLWSSDWSVNSNTDGNGRTYWVGSDVRCIKVRLIGTPDFIEIHKV